jgi:acyl dehydratase
MLRTGLDLSALAAGQSLPEHGHTFTEVDLVSYGAATWDWHRLHYDMAYARDKKLRGVLIDGQAFGAIFAREAMQWAGPKAFIQRMGLKMRSMAFAGDHLVAKGAVTTVEPQEGGMVVRITQQLMCDTRLVAEASTEMKLRAD